MRLQAGCHLGKVPGDVIIVRQDNANVEVLFDILSKAGKSKDFEKLYKRQTGQGSMFSSDTVALSPLPPSTSSVGAHVAAASINTVIKLCTVTRHGWVHRSCWIFAGICG